MKQTLVDFGFRLPSAMDNRHEAFRRVPRQGAADGLRLGHARRRSSAAARAASSRQDRPAHLHRRPRGRGPRDQEPDRRPDGTRSGSVTRRGPLPVTTLTKKMAEDLTDYLMEYGFRVRYLHSEIDTLRAESDRPRNRTRRTQRALKVTLLTRASTKSGRWWRSSDTDKEGFLRGETSLVQTIRRAGGGPRDHVRRRGYDSHAQHNWRNQPPPRYPGRLQQENRVPRRNCHKKGISDIGGASWRSTPRSQTREPPQPPARGGGPDGPEELSKTVRRAGGRRCCSPPTTCVSSMTREAAGRDQDAQARARPDGGNCLSRSILRMPDSLPRWPVHLM